MTPFLFIGFFLLTVSFLSIWLKKDPKIWGIFLVGACICGTVAGSISLFGLLLLFAMAIFWYTYSEKPKASLFYVLLITTLFYKFHLVPGYLPFAFTPKFLIGFDIAVTEFFPLAFLVPLATSFKDWKRVGLGFLAGGVGIALLAGIVISTRSVSLDSSLPPFMFARTWANLILTSIPEEGFFRGFLQRELCNFFQKYRYGNLIALFLTSIVFTCTHIFWSPNLTILAFVFIASLLYGGVYLWSGKIESAILTHFLLNLVHMLLFSYHAS